MPLRQDQTKEVLRLFQDGQSVDEIASGMHVAVADVEPFIPTGELLIAYQRVREAKRDNDTALEVMNAKTIEHNDNFNASGQLYKAGVEVGMAIKDSLAETKKLKAVMKTVNTAHRKINDWLADYDGEAHATTYNVSSMALEDAEVELELAKKADVLKRQKAADAVSRKQRAERMAENALIAAAVEAAKSIVSDSIDKRLIKEEKENAA